MQKRLGVAKGQFDTPEGNDTLDEMVASQFLENIETAVGESRHVRSPDAVVCEVGAHLRALRLYKNLSQDALAAQAGISVSLLRKLESGRGASLRTLVCVLVPLGRLAWLNTLAPVPTVNPLSLTKKSQTRQRASSFRKKQQAAKGGV